MFNIISSGSGFGSACLNFGNTGPVAIRCVCAKSETAAAADLIFYVFYLAQHRHIIKDQPTILRIGTHMFELQKRVIIMTLKSIRTANESLLSGAGAFRVFRVYPRFTIRPASLNEFSYRFLPNTYSGAAIRRSTANQVTICNSSCLKTLSDVERQAYKGPDLDCLNHNTFAPVS